MIIGNRGDWSEIYALFKLLGDKVLQPGDEYIGKIQNIIYPIIKILRSETAGEFVYSIQGDIVVISGGEEVLRISVNEFKEQSMLLLNSIKSNSKRTFSIPEIEKFMQSIHCTSLKASSSTKTDITIVVHDQITRQKPTLGFSIKSQLGSPSTLLNAGKTTNFIFEITNENFNSNDIQYINRIATKNKIKDKIEAIRNKGGILDFVSTERQIFSNNLVLIDSLLPEILSAMVFRFYTSNDTKVMDLVNVIQNKNVLNFDVSNNHQFYSYKIKRFLTDVALGMMPSKVWSGNCDATGGYLIVKEDGDIECYHLYNRNQFEEYLINNTKLETASSSRHGFGEIYTDNGKFFFKLNLQIRFIK